MANHNLRTKTGLFLLLSLVGSLAITSSASAQIEIFQDQNSKSTGITSLMSAVVDGDGDGVEFFIKSEPKSVNKKNLGGATALHIASRMQNPLIVKTLLENEANVNLVDEEGWTALMRASLAKNAEIVDLLLSKEANIFAVNNFNESALMHGASSNCNRCLELMFNDISVKAKGNEEKATKQINNAFIIAKKHDNQAAQDILKNALDEVINAEVTKTTQEDKKKETNLEIVDSAHEDLIEDHVIDLGDEENMHNETSTTVLEADVAFDINDEELSDKPVKKKRFSFFGLFAKEEVVIKDIEEEPIVEENIEEEAEEVETDILMEEETEVQEEMDIIDSEASINTLDEESQIDNEELLEQQPVKKKRFNFFGLFSKKEPIISDVEKEAEIEKKMEEEVQEEVFIDEELENQPMESESQGEELEIPEVGLDIEEAAEEVEVNAQEAIGVQDIESADEEEAKEEKTVIVDEIPTSESEENFEEAMEEQAIENDVEEVQEVQEVEVIKKAQRFTFHRGPAVLSPDLMVSEPPVQQEVKQKPVKKFRFHKGAKAQVRALEVKKEPIKKFTFHKGLSSPSSTVNEDSSAAAEGELEKVVVTESPKKKRKPFNFFGLFSKKKEFSIVE